ncbi:hypothetical protein VCUG_01741 [Vavraia culicis subsp. floridensis]|uniref:Uncharacterized protein n=1 Tax=Vavraia culicis (isolate floridensis) TaxID=948595 RepID=L2GTU6_VAVCU|nr:uncharacterized protein VCUG_01741 [Vavraia culicis subsp. floridensis]ELA46782.1 hypothetical protein VCUG_01741 [Vavraia culicis subsp. floridensis]
MIFVSKLLLIHQCLCTKKSIKEGDDGSEYVYTEEELKYDVEHLLDGPKQESDKKCARIVKYLKELNNQTLGKDLKRCNRYMNRQIFYHEYSKAIQFIYEAEKFSLYFSAQQEDNAEPMGGLKVLIDKKKIKRMKGIFKKLDRVYLTVIVRSSSKNLYDANLGDKMPQFDFITDLYLLNLTHLHAHRNGESCKTVQDFISLKKVRKLRTLKVKHMLVMDEFLEKVSSMKLESLSFTECVFLTYKAVQQWEEIKVTFAKSYKTICFSKCKRYVEYLSSYALGRKYSMAIKINLNKCTKLCNLTVNMDDCASVILSKQIVSGLRYLSLGENYCGLPLSSSKCQGARLEFLTIDTRDLELAVNFLKEINRNELKHLVLICYVCDVSNLFNLKFAALEVLEIDAGGNNLELKDKSTIEVKMKKLETLRINCWRVDKELMQMITELETLKHLEMLVRSWNVKYELVLRQLSSLKGPIEKLFVNSRLTISELVRLIEPLNELKEFYIDGRSIFLLSDSPANRNDDKFRSVKVDSNKQNLVKSRNVVHLKLHTLHIGLDSAYKELIQLMLCQDFEAFAGIKKLVIFEAPIDSWTRLERIQKLSEISPDLLNSLIKNIFETFKQLDVLIICYKSSCISVEEAHILRKLFSEKCRSLKERCEWSDECDEEQTIFELHK